MLEELFLGKHIEFTGFAQEKAIDIHEFTPHFGLFHLVF